METVRALRASGIHDARLETIACQLERAGEALIEE
jgi:hypothetical protein